MSDPFRHINHRAHERGGGKGGRSMRDTMMDEAARFSRDVKGAMAEERAKQPPKRSLWQRLTRKS